MSKLADFSDLDDLHLLEGLSLQEIEELSEAIDPEVSDFLLKTCFDLLE